MIDDPLNRLKVKRGEQLPWSKLTEKDVINIRALVDERAKLISEARKLTNANLAEKFGVDVKTIEKINAGQTWTHI
jgi:ribosome-binding protein aMBF1 (putative translation factor)